MSGQTIMQAAAARPAEQAVRTRVLRPRTGFGRVDIAELWRYRDLLLFLALRDVQVRYKQTLLGVAWAVLQPFVMMVVVAAFIGRFTGMSDPVALYAGLLPWTFFAASVTACTNSLVSNANLLQKVYFPRVLMPLGSLGAPLVDYGLASVVLLGLMAWYQVPVTWALALMPLLVVSMIVGALGVGLLMAGLTVSYRDFRYVVPFLLQVWFFLTPVIYELPARFAWLMDLNPVCGTIRAFRAVILGTPVDYAGWAVSVTSSLLCLGIALLYFNRSECRFADVI